MLDPGHPEALRTVIIALAKIGPAAKSAVPRLETLLTEITVKVGDSKRVQKDMITMGLLHIALVKISGKSDEHVQQLMLMLDRDYDYASRAIAAWMLGEIGPDAAPARSALVALSKEHPKQTFLQNPAPAAAARSLVLLEGKNLSYLHRLNLMDLEDDLMDIEPSQFSYGLLRYSINLSRF